MTALEHLLLVCIVVQVGQALPCDSPYRRYYPQFFTHCNCVYSEWSKWTYVSNSVANNSTCPLQLSYNETRFRSLTGLPWVCQESVVETRWKCVDDAQLLMSTFKLGARGTQNFQPIQTSDEPDHSSHRRDTQPPRCPSITGEYGYICHDMYRLIGHERQSSAIKDNVEEPSTQDDEHKPDRRQGRQCAHNETQYIVFVLDTSESISNKTFRRITSAIGSITALFCSPIRVAVMTFNQHFRLEFCFNCYENDFEGRSDLSQAIKNITYREGLSYAAGAARCVCRELLSETCGLPENATCIDVVVITDGRSNDPFLRICEEIECFHNRAINTYAIAAGDYDVDEIQCIKEKDVEVHLLFNKTTIEEVAKSFETALRILQEDNDDEYSCIDNSGLLQDIRKYTDSNKERSVSSV